MLFALLGTVFSQIPDTLYHSSWRIHHTLEYCTKNQTFESFTVHKTFHTILYFVETLILCFIAYIMLELKMYYRKADVLRS